jgi:hypothetical protein
MDGQGEDRVDSNRFDHLSRLIGAQTDRRSMFKTAAASGLAIAGLGALGRTALGQDVNIEAGFEGDSCDSNSDCRRGLRCNTNLTNPRCEYSRSCGGTKNQACKQDGECCRNRNLECRNRRCKRKNNR